MQPSLTRRLLHWAPQTCYSEVTGQGQLQSPAQGVAVDGSDRGHRQDSCRREHRLHTWVPQVLRSHGPAWNLNPYVLKLSVQNCSRTRFLLPRIFRFGNSKNGSSCTSPFFVRMQNMLLPRKEACKHKVLQCKTGSVLSLQIYDMNIHLLQLKSQRGDTIPRPCHNAQFLWCFC